MKHHITRILFGAAFAVSLPATATYAADASNAVGDPIGRFDITRFQVDGNTLLPPSLVENLLAPYAGQHRDFGDVQRALEALEAAYRAHGYNVVQVVLPEQELNRGVVRLKVVETKIGKVLVQGNQAFDDANIRRSLPDLREGEAPNIGRISAGLRLINENPAKKVSLQLQSGDQDDTVDAVLKINESKTWQVGANLDNTGTSSTGKTHLGLTYLNANLAGRDHVLSLQYTTTLEKPDQVSVYGAGYHIPLYGLGDSIDVFGSYSNVNSGSVAAGILNLQVSGKGAVYGARYNYGLGHTGDFESKLIVGLDYKAYQNNVQLVSLGGTTLPNSAQLGGDVTVHPLSANYLGIWTLAGGVANVNLGALFNVPGGAHGSAGDFARARTNATSRYKILRAGANLTHAWRTNWQTRLAFNAQYTPDALIPGEQFGVGGATSVRGFAEREVADDTGYALNAELHTPNLCTAIERVSTLCRALVFIDAAHAARNHALAGERTQVSIAGAGLGWRIVFDKYVALQFDYGRVIEGGDIRKTGSSRAHFAMSVLY